MIKSIIDYIVNDLGVERDTAVTIVVSLVTFGSGYLVTGLIKAIHKWRKQISYRKILKIIIDDFLNLCEKQHRIFENYSKEKGFAEGSNVNISVVPNFSQNYLAEVDVSIFIENFSLFFSKKRGIQISEFFELVETIKSNKIDLRTNINMAIDSYNRNLITYNQNLHSLERFKDYLGVEYNDKSVDLSFVKYLNGIYHPFMDWHKKGKSTNLKDTNEQIIQPILANLRILMPDKISHEAITFCLLAEGAYVNIINAENLIKDIISESAILYKSTYEKGRLLVKNW
jgi:hypothetical protein